IALTALIGAELATVVYGIVVRPAYLRSPDLIAAAIVTGALVLLRTRLPARLGPEAGGAVSTGIDPRFLPALMIVVYIIIAVILRVLLRTAFRRRGADPLVRGRRPRRLFRDDAGLATVARS